MTGDANFDTALGWVLGGILVAGVVFCIWWAWKNDESDSDTPDW
jgi:hypothetical protein